MTQAGPSAVGQAPRGDPFKDHVERLLVIDLPTPCRHVLRSAALDEEATLAVVQSEPHGVGGQLVDMQSDDVGAEPLPILIPLGFDDDRWPRERRSSGGPASGIRKLLSGRGGAGLPRGAPRGQHRAG